MYGEICAKETAGIFHHIHGCASHFRVGFYGPLFGADDGAEYIYRTPPGTSLGEAVAALHTSCAARVRRNPKPLTLNCNP